MLNHYVILPSTSPYLLVSNFLADSQQLNIKLIASNNYCFNRNSDTSLSFYGNERVLYSSIKINNGSNIPISLNQLRQIDFNNINSLHLIGSIDQLEFLCNILQTLESNINLFFSHTQNSDKVAVQKFLSIYNNITYINSELLENTIEYEKFILSKNNVKNIKMEACYSYDSNCSLVLTDGCKTSLFINGNKIIETIFELKNNKNQVVKVATNNTIAKKIRKLRQNPKLFFKDMINKYRR